MSSAPQLPPPEVGTAAGAPPLATRRDLQAGRRLIHMANGVAIASAYSLLFTHRQVVHIFGIIACVVYILDRVRIHYPELAARVPLMNRVFFRAEEEFKESAMIPYAIAILLTMLTFPKPVALIAIYTLAIADPMSAMVGITWGRHRIVPDRSIEGSAAFFACTFAIAATTLATATASPGVAIAGTALAIAALATLFDMFPLRIDDNLTIPLFVGFTTWIACALTGVAVD